VFRNENKNLKKSNIYESIKKFGFSIFRPNNISKEKDKNRIRQKVCQTI
jgi:hypothetical protein